MGNQAFEFSALILYFAVLIGIGYYAYTKTTDHEGYMLAGRELPSWTAALSAGASDMSGWLMMGLPGAIYAAGLIEAWIAIGLTLGADFNWLFVTTRLRACTAVGRNPSSVRAYL